MNVYRFINSKDIREHLESIKYPFGSLEAAWLIYQCRFASLEEKHAAWRELIRTVPDCAIEERPNTEAHDSLHRFLAAYMERETKLLHVVLRKRRRHLSLDGGVRRTACGSSTRVSIPTMRNAATGSAGRSATTRTGGSQAILSPKHIPTQRSPACNRSFPPRGSSSPRPGEAKRGPTLSRDCFFVFPTPFQKGDIVWEPNTQGYCKGPFVLTGVSGEAEAPGHRRGGDNSDMTAWGYFQDESGNIYHETMWNYMDLEYYRGPLTGKRRVLRALGNCLKGGN